MELNIVGDLHLKRSNLVHFDKLKELIFENAKNCKYTIFMGDEYHDFGVVSADVQNTFLEFIKELSKITDILFVGGNHTLMADQVNNLMSVLDLMEFENNVYFVSQSELFGTKDNRFGLVGFQRDNAKFIELANSLDCKTVFAHVEVDGCQYENGFYSKHGVDPKLINKKIVSGHIHAISEFGPVTYVGAPWHLTKSDVNQKRGIWTLTMENGEVINKEFKSTEDVVPFFREIDLKDTENLPDFPKKDKIFVNYHGEDKKDIKKIQQKYPLVSIKHIVEKKQIVTTISENKSLRENIDSVIGVLSVPKAEKVKEEIFSRLGL